MTQESEEVSVIIPGDVMAHLWLRSDGTIRIEQLTFTPSAGDAGYFGPKAIVWSGPEAFEDHEALEEDVEDVEGRFWAAVREYLATYSVSSIEWTE